MKTGEGKIQKIETIYWTQGETMFKILQMFDDWKCERPYHWLNAASHLDLRGSKYAIVLYFEAEKTDSLLRERECVYGSV